MPTPAETAANRYNAETRRIRATLNPATTAYADAMSAACREYEAAMADAARTDKAARRALNASVGPYLRGAA